MFPVQCKIAKYCKTRWLSRLITITTILDNWENLDKYLRARLLDNVKVSKTLTRLNKYMGDKEILLYLEFLRYALSFFDEFSITFQSTKSRAHLLHKESMNLLRNFAKHFIQPKLMETDEMLLKLDFSKESNHKKVIDYGSYCNAYIQLFSAETLENVVDEDEEEEILQEINELADCDEIVDETAEVNEDEDYVEIPDDKVRSEEQQVKRFKRKALKFFIAAAKNMVARLPLHDEFFKALNVFSFSDAIQNEDLLGTFEPVKIVINRFGDFDEGAVKKE